MAVEYKLIKRPLVFTQRSHDYRELFESSITYYKDIDGSKQIFTYTGTYERQPFLEWIQHLEEISEDL